MTHRVIVSIVMVSLALAPVRAQVGDRALTDAMRAIYSLRSYTAFDWISARYQKGVLTLEGFVRTSQLKQEAEAAARKTRGIEEVNNRLEVLPTHSTDDDIRINAYVAIFGSSALERYAPGGQLSGAAISELRDTARFGLEGTDVGRGPHAIHIIVSGARVLLLGEVRAAGDRRIAESAVRTLPGLLGVTNQLRVPPKQ
ncbi:MAG: BON domain-containing protein [Vicinamibacterales bacterium]